MVTQAVAGDRVREIDEESLLEFIAGFPCTQFGCYRALRKQRHNGRWAIVCPGCGSVYYVLARG